MRGDKANCQGSPTTQLIREMVDLFSWIEELQDRELLVRLELIDKRHREEELINKNLRLERLVETRDRQVKETRNDLEQAIDKSRQQYEEFRNLRANLEIHLALRDLEIERLKKELQRQSAIREEIAHIIQVESSKFEALVDSFRLILHSGEERSPAGRSRSETHAELEKAPIFRIK